MYNSVRISRPLYRSVEVLYVSPCDLIPLLCKGGLYLEYGVYHFHTFLYSVTAYSITPDDTGFSMFLTLPK